MDGIGAEVGCVLCGEVLRWEGYGGRIREPEAVELDEGVKGPLVSQSMKQVIFILTNIQERFAATCLDIVLHGMFSFLYCLSLSFSCLKIPLQTAGAQHTKLRLL